MNKGSSIFIVSCFLKNQEQINLLHNLCRKILENGFEYILTSHTQIPDHIVSSSRAYIFDSNNHLLPVEGRDLTKRSSFWIRTDSFTIESPLLSHGGNPCYAQAHLDLVYNGMLTALRLGYKLANFITYDANFEPQEIERRTSLLQSGQADFVGYWNKEKMLLADNWSINLRSLDLTELLINRNLMSARMEGLQYDDCKYLEKYLLSNMKMDMLHYDYLDPMKGSYSTPLKDAKAEWALFEYENGVNLFVQNNKSETMKVSCYTRNGRDVRIVGPFSYIWFRLYENGSYGFLTLLFDREEIVSIDLSNPTDKRFWVDFTKFFPNNNETKINFDI